MEIIIIAILILFNAFFSMAEISLIASKKYKLELSAKKGNKNATNALELTQKPDVFLSATQTGITLVSILTGIYSGDSLAGPLSVWISDIQFLAPYAGSLSISLVVIFITFLSIVFGELVPKNISLIYPEAIALMVAFPMKIIYIAARPFIWLLTISSDFILAIFGVKRDDNEHVSEEEIKSIIKDSTNAGEIQEIEQDIVERVFLMGDRKVSEIMTHRNDIKWIDIHDNLSTVKARIKEELHSAYLVCDKSLDNWKGVVFIKELFPARLDEGSFRLNNFIRKPIIFSENTSVYRAIEKFKENRFHYGIVVDEYGSLQGLIAMDDVLDALLGDMIESDRDEEQIVRQDEHTWIVEAQIPYYIFCEHFELNEDDFEGNFNTLGGFILEELGHIPTVGEKLNHGDFEFEISQMAGVRIDKVLVRRNLESI